MSKTKKAFALAAAVIVIACVVFFKVRDTPKSGTRPKTAAELMVERRLTAASKTKIKMVDFCPQDTFVAQGSEVVPGMKMTKVTVARLRDTAIFQATMDQVGIVMTGAPVKLSMTEYDSATIDTSVMPYLKDQHWLVVTSTNGGRD